jgi:hypothetical protein
MARLKAETTETDYISRTELHDEPERVHHERETTELHDEPELKFRVHYEWETRRRAVRLIKASVPAYASDLELMRVAAHLSGLRRDGQTKRSPRGQPRIASEMQD